MYACRFTMESVSLGENLTKSYRSARIQGAQLKNGHFLSKPVLTCSKMNRTSSEVYLVKSLVHGLVGVFKGCMTQYCFDYPFILALRSIVIVQEM